MANLTLNERIAIVETEQRALKTQLTRVEDKLDELLALRNKGAGVFWLASSLIGSGIIGLAVAFIDWLKH